MVQDYTADTYDASHVGAVDLQNIEDNFAALKSSFSGSSSPGNPVAGMVWFDTGNAVLKYRDVGNSTWYSILVGGTGGGGAGSMKLWVYSNSAIDGWVVDSTVTDKVIAVKGGSTYLAGGVTAGTWTQPNHVLTIAEIPSHRHAFTEPLLSYTGGSLAGAGDKAHHVYYTDYVGGGGAHNHGSTYRPYAAVGTIQYPIG